MRENVQRRPGRVPDHMRWRSWSWSWSRSLILLTVIDNRAGASPYVTHQAVAPVVAPRRVAAEGVTAGPRSDASPADPSEWLLYEHGLTARRTLEASPGEREDSGETRLVSPMLAGFEPGLRETLEAAFSGIAPRLPDRPWLFSSPYVRLPSVPEPYPDTKFAISEPASIVLLTTGLIGLAARRHLRRKLFRQ